MLFLFTYFFKDVKYSIELKNLFKKKVKVRIGCFYIYFIQKGLHFTKDLYTMFIFIQQVPTYYQLFYMSPTLYYYLTMMI